MTSFPGASLRWVIWCAGLPSGQAAKPRLKSFAQRHEDTKMSRSPRSGLLHPRRVMRSEEHTSELQSLMRSSYAVLFLIKHKTLMTIEQSRQHVRSVSVE